MDVTVSACVPCDLFVTIIYINPTPNSQMFTSIKLSRGNMIHTIYTRQVYWVVTLIWSSHINMCTLWATFDSSCFDCTIHSATFLWPRSSLFILKVLQLKPWSSSSLWLVTLVLPYFEMIDQWVVNWYYSVIWDVHIIYNIMNINKCNKVVK